MTIALRYAARSDVGLLREGNEDSAFAGPRLLAVADGMGGHAGGEVASSVAIAAMASLDEAVAPDADLLGAIEAAVRDANRRLHEIVAREPSLKGMGTTLTAMLWSGRRVALVHVGDSRAYLLRGGELYQITHDHTLVQSLVDDGRITAEEAATHPQRSILLRALDGSGEVEPDLSLREAQVNDRYLLCSDGLSGVISPETLHQTLSTLEDPEAAVRQLIDLANRGGGPDNITCVVADVIELGPGEPGPPAKVAVVGAAGNNRMGPSPLPDTPAGRASALTSGESIGSPPVAEEDEPEPPRAEDPPARRRRLWPAVLVTLVLLLGALGVGGYFGYQYTRDQFFVGKHDSGDGAVVAIFQGIDQSIFGFDLFTLDKATTISFAGLPATQKKMVEDGIRADSREAAEQQVDKLRASSGDTPPPAGDDSPDATGSPTPDPTTQTRPTGAP
ncbi:Stp1/IreP family PP2C-type Ser/Thr phosphatase [Bailinhaonella thermotolerans]|uniref:Serine/threonine protein phosphatase PstP n=1 Tax=Bailinhaonella thermotolerans TaxID=1070861 RepID=A0A3A4B2G7_9ACTN|nr:Stp1/IreP family PP2C-type Ser/Thr phosphatase [Bailinhaonella thermotolerans]RJL32187.1 Stp1/IreP family PP2C-type Ser/Thr phosphatase [Bailinhaonella thermotolerans]